MTKCLFKALKAVDLDKHVGLFRSLGYDSAGALAHFRAEHFENLHFTEQELLHLIALLDVLKDATREGKICPHYFHSTKTNTQATVKKSTPPIRASWSDETIPQQYSKANRRKPLNENIQTKRSTSSIGIPARSSAISMAPTKKPSNDVIPQRSSTVLSRDHPITPSKTPTQRILGPKSLFNRPAVQHIKVKSYNYGVPTNRRSRNSFHHQHHHSIFVSSPRHSNDSSSYGKPAEIFVYARKRPLLSTETNFQDSIAVPDNKRIIIAENKANLDSTLLLKKTEFQFDHVFGSDTSNREVFESTVLPFLSPNYRHNLTYICFGQTGSGKSHTIFGSKTNDGLLVYCTQVLLKETINFETTLVCSFYEIYNNQVYDLVNSGKRLFVREDGEHHVNVIGATEFVLQNLDNLHYVIDDGLTRRHHGKSAFNSNSSRSHAVFQILLKNNSDASECFRLIFIDLAGSERAIDAQNNPRQTRREGAQINWSLLALKECIRSMDLTHSHAPFRQSKLTHILRDSLVGSKTRTCLMANVSPANDCCQCSLNTLQYASRIRDISIRHRHRSMPTTNISMNYMDETIKEQEKPQRNFKPATASTPVQRLIPTVDQRIYMSNNQTDVNSRRTKPFDIDWQIVDDDDDDDLSVSGGGDNQPLKTLTSAAREFLINSNLQSENHTFNRIQVQKLPDHDDSPSSYFPQPQSDIKKSSVQPNKRSYDSSQLMHDNGNERQWKVVPAPTTNQHSNSSIESSNPARIIPVAPIQISDENPYSSATGTESLGTKISKAATNGSQRQQKSYLIKSLNLKKLLNTGAMTSDTEAMIDSDRRDPREFFTHRKELLTIVSNRLTPNSKRSSSVLTPKHSKMNSSYSSKSKHSAASSGKIRQKNRLIKSASSSTSLTSVKQEKKPSVIDQKKSKISSSINFQKFDPTTIRRSPNRHHHQRAVPLRVPYSSDSEEQDKIRHHIHRRKGNSSKNTSYSTRSEACQTMNEDPMMKIEHEQTNFSHKNEHSASLLLTPTSTPLPPSSSSPGFAANNSIHASLDQVKLAFGRSLQQPISPLTSVNIDNPWPLTTSYSSPSKEFGMRVSDQLNALRSLLENRLVEHDETKRSKNESSTLQTSPGTFARDFLQSFRQSTFPNHSRDFPSDLDDEDKEVERNFHPNYPHDKLKPYEGDLFSTTTTSSNPHHHHHHHHQLIQPSLSSLSDELNQARVSSSTTPTSSSTIESNLAAKIDTQERRILSDPTDGIHSHQLPKKNHFVSNPTSDSERTSQVNFTSQNPFTGTSSGGSSSNHSRSRSPIHFPSSNTFDVISSTTNGHEQLFDSSKGNSFLTGSSFDALLNSLKSMREKDLDFVVRTGDEKLIPVAD